MQNYFSIKMFFFCTALEQFIVANTQLKKMSQKAQMCPRAVVFSMPFWVG